jgi:DNA-binding response OmpR family regulator
MANGERIMVVEDDPLVMNILAARIKGQGYQVTEAASVAQALRLTRDQVPDLIILDLTLLDGDPFAGLTDGFAFLTLLQRSHPGTRVPVIINSVDNSPKVHERARQLGAAAVCDKSHPLAELLAAVRSALERRQPAAVGALQPA